MAFLKAQGGTLLVLSILILLVALIIRSLIRDRRSGKGACGGHCASCAHRCPSGMPVIMTVGIEGMVCPMCESHVREALQRELRPLQVSVSHKKGIAIVAAPRPIPLSEFSRALAPTGYRVTSVEIQR